MSRLRVHSEHHLVERIGWLRAAVLGANDGIVSTASLIVGVAAAAAAPSDVLIAGVAGLVAGAMSMAAGEYVSVSSQADTEHADLARESAELKSNPAFELEELSQIYVQRGVEAGLARQVAEQLLRDNEALGNRAEKPDGPTGASLLAAHAQQLRGQQAADVVMELRKGMAGQPFEFGQASLRGNARHQQARAQPVLQRRRLRGNLDPKFSTLLIRLHLK